MVSKSNILLKIEQEICLKIVIDKKSGGQRISTVATRQH